MSDRYRELLDATIQHLEELQAAGERWLPVDPGLLRELSRPVATVPTPVPATESKSAPQRVVVQIPPAPTPAEPTELLVPLEPAAPASAPLTSAEKTAAMAELRQKVLACQNCPHLVRSRKSVVFGVGDIHSPLMFVGEAPGADEDVQGEPFVGAAGQLLTRIIKTMGYSREMVYIANVLKCRPDTPDQSYGNRKPTSEEMKTCLPHLLEQIRLIQPKVIVALGATAMEGLFGKTCAITRVRGNWHSFQGTPVMPTYHPSYLLRNQAPVVKRQLWEDMLAVMERLGAPISEKQRNYFKMQA
jgi:uracil-DNA glycosylase